MGREVRKVPADWVHPKDNKGHYQPMYDQSFREAAEQWIAGLLQWMKGEHPSQKDGCGKDCPYYWQYEGNPPDEEYYRPDWPEETRTHLMMYETVSEGTPISPAFKTPEELAQWLYENRANAGAGMTATYEQWLSMIHDGSAPSFIYSPKTGIISGVAASLKEDP